MLWLALGFLALALAAAVLGFGVVPVGFAIGAKFIFYIAFVLFVVMIAGRIVRRI